MYDIMTDELMWTVGERFAPESDAIRWLISNAVGLAVINTGIEIVLDALIFDDSIVRDLSIVDNVSFAGCIVSTLKQMLMVWAGFAAFSIVAVLLIFEYNIVVDASIVCRLYSEQGLKNILMA